MKLLQIILALYVLVLSALPCEALCLDESTPVAAQASQPGSDHSHDETCSPFCLCATCPGFTVPQTPQLEAAITQRSRIPVAVLPFYQALHTLDVSDSIWQPPRLS
ncbi:DUF6660 family protein [Nibrella saemangeumensis]|uniref:DUF6660 family protein n=1 Tax=Nibrella saemangeumensis TaxID=1084526 RepID=UPI003CD0C11B